MEPLSEVTAGEVMTAPVAYVMAETPVAEIARLLLREGISAAPVLGSSGRLVGIVSEGDLVRRRPAKDRLRRSWWLDLFEADARQSEEFLNYLKIHGLRAKDVMSREVVSATEDTTIAEIAALLEANRIKRVPVLRDGELTGIVSRADLVRALVHARPVPDRAPGSARRSSSGRASCYL